MNLPGANPMLMKWNHFGVMQKLDFLNLEEWIKICCVTLKRM
jgi:hypothetical protein